MHAHSGLHTHTMPCYLSCSNYTAGANRGCNFVSMLKKMNVFLCVCVCPWLNVCSLCAWVRLCEADHSVEGSRLLPPCSVKGRAVKESSSESESSSGSQIKLKLLPSTVTPETGAGSSSESQSVSGSSFKCMFEHIKGDEVQLISHA